jgi:diguanylate cyclase (GGDEF)-like protein
MLKRWSGFRPNVRANIISASPPLARRLVAGLFLALVLADYCSPRYITFGTFFLVLIAYTSWTLGRRAGWMIAALTISASLAINGFGTFVGYAHGSERYLAIGWNLGMRLLSSGAVVELVLGFRRSFEQEKRAGETDSLTGIQNRRAFISSLRSGMSHAHASTHVGIIVYIDLDGFKSINDRFGHTAGDDVLIRFAELLATTVRGTDSVGRIGGDEFALFLNVPSVSIAQRAALGLQRRLDDGLKAMPYEGLACSIGAVIVPEKTGSSVEALLKHADELMFEAKAGGFMRIALLDRALSQTSAIRGDARLQSVK